MNRKLLITLILIGLVLSSVVAYWNAPKGDFIWDDINLIVLDHQIKSWKFIKNVFTRDFFGFTDDDRKYGYYRPLVTISYAIDWRLNKLNPAGYHRTNILIHVICTFLLFFIFYRLTDRKLLAPTLAGLIFSVHPIHTESVTWIAGRTDPMAALFFLGGFLTFIVYSERLAAAKGFEPLPPGTHPHAASQPRLGLMILMPLLFVGGLLAKEVMLALPLICAAYLLVYVTGWHGRRMLAYLPIFLLQVAAFAGYFLFRFFRVGFSQQAKHPFEVIDVILTFIKTIGYYVIKMLVPVHLSAYIQNPLVESIFEPKFIAAFLFLAALIALIWRTFKRDKIISFSLMFLLLSLLPMSNFIRISGPKDMGFMTAERFIYIPSAAVCLILGVLLARLLGRLGRLIADSDWSGGKMYRRVLAGVVLMVMVPSLTALTLRRNVDWYDNETIFNQMIANAPNATLLYVVLGNIYRFNKKYDEAEQVLQKALEFIAPRNREEPTWIYNDLAAIYAEQGRFDEALRVMKLASRTREHNSAVQYNYGEIYRAMGDCDMAIRYYQRSLAIYRDNLNAFVKMGMCYQSKGLWEAANKSYLSAVNLTPHDGNLLNQVGYNYYQLGVLDKAEEYLTAALTEKPDSLEAKINFAILRFKQGRISESKVILREVLDIDPDNADAHAALGHVLANQGQYVDAGNHVMRVLQMNPKHVLARLTYAAVALQSNPAHARQGLLALLEEHPYLSEAAFVIGLSYEREKNREKTIEWYRRTLEINPRHMKALGKLKEMDALPTPEEPLSEVE